MNKFKILLLYYRNYLLSNLWIILLFVLIVLSPIPTILCSYYLNSNILYYSSFIIAIVPFVLLLITIIVLNILLYTISKYNLSDIKLLGKRYTRNQLFFSKYIIINIYTLISIVSEMFISLIILLLLKIEQQVIIGIILSNLIGLIINLFCLNPISMLIANLCNLIITPIVLIGVNILFPISCCVNNYLLATSSKNNDININLNQTNAKVSYAKIYNLDNSNSLINYKYAYSINNDKNCIINLNSDVQNSLNYINKFNPLLFLAPISLSVQQSIFNSCISDVSSYINNLNLYCSSLTRIVPTNFIDTNNYFNNHNNFIINNVDDNNLFLLNNNFKINLIINEINNILKSNEYNTIDSLEIKAINNAFYRINPQTNPQGYVKKPSIWNLKSLTEKQIKFVLEFIGLNKTIFFNIWYYYPVFNSIWENLFTKIINNYGNELAILLANLWTNNSTFLNIITLNNLNEIKNYFNNKYLMNYMLTNNDASKENIDFIEKILVYIPTSNMVNILCNENTYIPIDINIFKQKFNINAINNQNDWINFIEGNKPITTSKLMLIYNKLTELLPSIIQYNFDNSNFESYQFQELFDLNTEPFYNGWQGFIVLEIFIGILFFYIAYYLYHRKIKI